MYHLRTAQSKTLTYLARVMYVIAAIEIAVNVAPTKLTVGLVGAALVLAIYDVSRQLKALLAALFDCLAVRIERAVERHAGVVEADGRRQREVVMRATVNHASAIGDKVANLERVAVKIGTATFQGYMDASRDGGGTQPFRIVR